MLNAAGPETHFAIVIVQHLDPTHESLLAELLARHTTMPVRQVEGGELVRPGEVHVIPPGHKLEIRGGRLELTEFIQPRGLRRPIDDFFESLARDQGSNAACVILSGTGADGTKGLRAIKEHGGLCIAQDPDTAKYGGMPVSAVVFTVWLSMTPALGLASRRSRSRAAVTRTALIARSRPVSRKAWK
ncbi:chemotaxis protein CheB [Jiella sp. KSK16Y-1]|uniref:protein-glutamate methylesterase n=1 Tax=Jiella mangrovi TaxID=2821407 RepID=A0ABS4BNL7_9HYPH|nr:chemotaxis protein CheB [Jiella mangrovi]